MAIQQDYDPSLIYLSLKEVDGAHCLVDQDGRRLAWVRDIQPHLPFDEIATCSCEIVLSRPGAERPEKFCNRPLVKR